MMISKIVTGFKILKTVTCFSVPKIISITKMCFSMTGGVYNLVSYSSNFIPIITNVNKYTQPICQLCILTTLKYGIEYMSTFTNTGTQILQK